MIFPHQAMVLTVNWAGQDIRFNYWYEACKLGYRGGLLDSQGIRLPDKLVTASSLGELEEKLAPLIIEAMER
jgi:hypothetical protein